MTVPAYQQMLAAYHRAFAGELRAMIATLPIGVGQSVLDLACGDGLYSRLLAARVGASGRVVGVDVRPDCLELARAEANAGGIAAGWTAWVAAAIEALPFRDGGFDLCWCAQSFFSLPDPLEAVRRMARVTKPGGVVGVLEDDTLHQILLPWPVELELVLRAAEWRHFTARVEHPRKFYVGRRLRAVLREAGLEAIETRGFATDRGAPLGADETVFLTAYLRQLGERVTPYLDAATRTRFERLAEPTSEAFLLNDPDLTMTCIDHVAWGRKGK